MNGIYIHIPFCASKCYYCDFNSGYKKNIKAYIQALEKEIINKPHFFEKVHTIYLGGGTPSYIDKQYINDILNIIKNEYDCSDIREITIEVNPDSADEEKIAYYRDIGINRLSIGIQSFNNNVLKLLNRKHNNTKAIETINYALKYFNNISIDLLWGINNYNIEIPHEVLSKINHISLYLLTLKENSLMYKYDYIDKKDIEIEKEYMFLIEYMKKHRFAHYEISNYAKRGYECKHNNLYWDNENMYIGYGLSAASYSKIKRCVNTGDFNKYIKGEYEDFEEHIDKYIFNIEKIMLALRTSKGIELDKYIEYINMEQCELLLNRGVLKKSGNIIKINEKSMIIMNGLLIKLIKW